MVGGWGDGNKVEWHGHGCACGRGGFATFILFTCVCAAAPLLVRGVGLVSRETVR